VSGGEESDMRVRVGINGVGRIGRAFLRRSLQLEGIEVVVINDITDARTLAHLLEFDSTYGRLYVPVSYSADAICVGDRTIAVLSQRDPADIDWGDYGAEIVVESTGRFRTRDEAARHVKGRRAKGAAVGAG
jgi:glyceraldehyde 3-phosphate dehydrogenase